MKNSSWALSATAIEAAATAIAVELNDPAAIVFACLTIALAVLVLAAVVTELRPAAVERHQDEELDERLHTALTTHLRRSS